MVSCQASTVAPLSCAGLTQWGHVFTVKARKHLDDAAADGKPIDDVRATVEDLWAQVTLEAHFEGPQVNATLTSYHAERLSAKALGSLCAWRLG